MKRAIFFKIVAGIIGAAFTYIIITRTIDSVAKLLNPSNEFHILPTIAIILDIAIMLAAGAAIVLLFISVALLIQENSRNNRYISMHEQEMIKLKERVRNLEKRMDNQELKEEERVPIESKEIVDDDSRVYQDLIFKNFLKDEKCLDGNGLSLEMKVSLMCDVYDGINKLFNQKEKVTIKSFNDDEIVVENQKKKRISKSLPLFALYEEHE